MGSASSTDLSTIDNDYELVVKVRLEFFFSHLTLKYNVKFTNLKAKNWNRFL